jgi:hypothetical protein
MKNNSTILHEVTPDQIASLFEGLQNQIKELNQKFEPKKATEFLTKTEVKNFFKCDLSTIHNWTVKGKLTPYGIGNRVYYKRSEVESALVCLGKNKGGKDE